MTLDLMEDNCRFCGNEGFIIKLLQWSKSVVTNHLRWRTIYRTINQHHYSPTSALIPGSMTTVSCCRSNVHHVAKPSRQLSLSSHWGHHWRARGQRVSSRLSLITEECSYGTWFGCYLYLWHHRCTWKWKSVWNGTQYMVLLDRKEDHLNRSTKLIYVASCT